MSLELIVMKDEPAATPPEGQLLIYQDGSLSVQVRVDGEMVWLTQAAMAELYQTTPQNITLHLANIYDDGELLQAATCKDYLQVRREGPRDVTRSLKHYNLDAILAVGYRVCSARGTAFRQWATARLSELLVKGFTLDDERIKSGRTLGDAYFDELVERIRDIRASERKFYQKITDIYATSIDYDAGAEATKTFYATRAEQTALGHPLPDGGGDHPSPGRLGQGSHGSDLVEERPARRDPEIGRDYRKELPH